MKIRLLFVCLFLFLSSCGQPYEAALLSSDDPDSYPMTPVESVTPGSTCDDPDEIRYPEHISYCERRVSTETKKSIIREYDREFGFSIGRMNRSSFKIDHYIPLCIGGSNQRTNLWPQHQSVFKITDPIEQKLCDLLRSGKLKQADAIEKIKHVKNNLETAPELISQLNSMLGRQWAYTSFYSSVSPSSP